MSNISLVVGERGRERQRRRSTALLLGSGETFWESIEGFLWCCQTSFSLATPLICAS